MNNGEYKIGMFETINTFQDEKLEISPVEEVDVLCSIDIPEDISIKHENSAIDEEQFLMPTEEFEVKPSDDGVNTQFHWLYSDEDILSVDILSDVQLANRTKTRRAKFKAQSGIVWCANKTSETLPKTLPSMYPKSKGPAKTVSNPLESWLLYLDEPILQIITTHTNENIRRLGRDVAPHQKPTDILELRAWFGLKYLCGIFCNSKNSGNIDELWSLELGNAVFRATMSYKRFDFLNENVQIIHKDVGKYGYLNAVKNILDKFLINCRSYYAPSNVCSVQKYSLDIGLPSAQLWVLCDTKAMYFCNALLRNSSNITNTELSKLVCDIRGTGRCVHLTHALHSITTGKSLQRNNVSVLYTLEKDSADLPEDIIDNGCTVYANDLSLTLNNDNQYIFACGLSENVCPLKLSGKLNHVKQTLEQCLTDFSTTASILKKDENERNWQMNFLNCMLDIAALNAWTLLRLSDVFNDNIDQRDFQRRLGLYLTQEQLQRRLHQKNNLSLIQKLYISDLLGEPTEALLSEATVNAKKSSSEGIIPSESVMLPKGIVLCSKSLEKRKRCRCCPWKAGNKSRFRCQQCQLPYCSKNLISRCPKCTGVVQQAHEEAQ